MREKTGEQGGVPFTRTLADYKWLFAAMILVGSGVPLAAWPSLPQWYESSAMIVLRPSGRDGGPSGLEAFKTSLDERAVQTEVEILQSRSLIDRTMERLRLYHDPEFMPDGVSVGVRLVRLAPAHLQAGLRRIFAISEEESRPLPAAQRDFLARNAFQHHLSVSYDRRSYAIRVSFRSADPRRAALIVNTLADQYLDQQRVHKTEMVASQEVSLEGQVKERREDFRRSQRAVQEYMKAAGLNDAVDQVSSVQRLGTFNSELALARGRGAEASARARAIGEMIKAGTVDSAPEVLASPVIRELKQKLILASGRAGGGMVQEINAVREATVNEAYKIARSLQVEAEVMSARENALRQDIAQIEERLNARALAEGRLGELRLESEADRRALDGALSRMRDRQSGSDDVRPDAQVVAAAEIPAEPSWPKLPLILAVAVVAATVIATLTILIIHAVRWRRLLPVGRLVSDAASS